MIRTMKNFRELQRHICVFPKEIVCRRRHKGYVKVGYVKEKTVVDGRNGTLEGCMTRKNLKGY